MNTVTIRVASLEEAQRSMEAALEGDKQYQGSYITFLDWDSLWKTLSPKKMHILHCMTGAGELSIREVARRVERDVKAVHTDLQALLACGIVDKGTAGVIFPYDQIHFDFVIGKAA
ncbi:MULTISPECIES: glycosyl transferase family 1 [Serratia]|uniref:Predicted transcriptional regulator n=2 Tax=Serratia fonticola TaxID=47917 RepID=A0A0F7HAY6_SERFO|nr:MULTISPECIES: glycosyl transferase family 1 [Serratia]AKG69244.1 glycosyl transferase family 1 [Serratia fonticola]MBE0150258.1 glycosyl transferase family 1 [Serratia fonticola]MBL5827749.1 glycosyl transferase family 1 [Serratia fonticola]MBL5860951.1 glycosyl transferase family 1 [Serratia fonticola]MBL5904294.1 glycosyl transferase family 1 [Serratia fonticola]